MIVFGYSPTPPSDPRVDDALEALIEKARVADPYLAADGRDRWIRDGKRDQWIVEFARAVRRVAPKYGLKPRPTDAFVTAHAALSTGYGRSILSRYVHNAFGIKGTNKETWPGPVIRSMTTEYENGVPYREWAIWRVYESYDGVVSDHLKMLTREGSRYANAAKKLRSGDLDYMAQLGRDGWYTDTPEKINAEWLAILHYVQQVLALATTTTKRMPVPLFAALALAVGLGVAYTTAVYIEPVWRTQQTPVTPMW
jgi:hypothetical protein